MRRPGPSSPASSPRPHGRRCGPGRDRRRGSRAAGPSRGSSMGAVGRGASTRTRFTFVTVRTTSTGRSTTSTATSPDAAARRCSHARCRHVAEHHFGTLPRAATVTPAPHQPQVTLPRSVVEPLGSSCRCPAARASAARPGGGDCNAARRLALAWSRLLRFRAMRRLLCTHLLPDAHQVVLGGQQGGKHFVATTSGAPECIGCAAERVLRVSAWGSGHAALSWAGSRGRAGARLSAAAASERAAVSRVQRSSAVAEPGRRGRCWGHLHRGWVAGAHRRPSAPVNTTLTLARAVGSRESFDGGPSLTPV